MTGQPARPLHARSHEQTAATAVKGLILRHFYKPFPLCFGIYADISA
jgi:hypothetical protein